MTSAIPADAQRSPDGLYWWDVEKDKWQLVSETEMGVAGQAAAATEQAGAAAGPFHPSTHGEFDPQVHGSFDPQAHGQFEPQTHGRFDKHKHGSFHPQTHGSFHPQTHGEFDPQVHGDFHPQIHGDFHPQIHGEFDPARHGAFHPQAHGAFHPQHHGEFDPSRHGEYHPQIHGEFHQQLHGEHDPARHGEFDPQRHGELDPHRHGAATAAAHSAQPAGYSVDWSTYPVLLSLFESRRFDEFAASQGIDVTAVHEAAGDLLLALQSVVNTIEMISGAVPITMVSADIAQMLVDNIVIHHEGVEPLLREAATKLHSAGKPEADACERTADTLGQEAQAVRGVLGSLHGA